MSEFAVNALWGLKYGAVLALAFVFGIVVSFLAQGSAAFAAYHPSITEMLVAAVATWLIGGLLVGATRPLARSSLGYLVVWILGGVFVAVAALVIVVGFSYLSVGTTLVAGGVLGYRGWAMLGRRSPRAV